MRRLVPITALLILPAAWLGAVPADDKQPDRPWRVLPLITGGKVDPNWVQVGWGGFAVDGDALRTDCDGKGMGLLLYKKETFGDCQLRVVYRPEDPKSNSGVFVRVGDGILDRLAEKAPAVRRTSVSDSGAGDRYLPPGGGACHRKRNSSTRHSV